jgi:c-di-GMP-binding flagellar brake protein YcgR
VLRLQRREFFRLPPPAPTWWCELPWSDPAFAPLQAEEPKLKLRVLDLSVGGVALLFPPEAPAPAHGHQFAGARLILPPMDWLETAMEVRSILPLDTPGPARVVPTRVGFRFIGMPTAAANRLYRFLFELQREQLAARRGT